MTMKFIYVMCDEAKTALMERGLRLLKSDLSRHVYVFENRESMVFDKFDFPFVMSSTLTF